MLFGHIATALRLNAGLARRGERGQVLPLVAVALLPLIALASMAVDAGMWRYQQQLAQTAADSGALAAAVELENSGTPAQIYAAANTDATANGFAGSFLQAPSRFTPDA